MKPAPFDYVRVTGTEEALDVLAAEGEDARILAGGQSLVAMLNMRLARPAVLVDLMHAAELRQIRMDAGALVIPAAVRQAELARYSGLDTAIPLLAQVLPWVGHPQTRARGTVCGSLAHADPSAELPLALAALDAEVVVRNRKRRRTVSAKDFILGTMLTDLAPDELVEAVRIPVQDTGTGSAFREVSRRRGDFAIVACAALVKGRRIRLAVGGIDDTPVIRDWEELAPADIAEALNAFAWTLDARDDLHATARYRRDLVRNLGATVIREAQACAG